MYLDTSCNTKFSALAFTVTGSLYTARVTQANTTRIWRDNEQQHRKRSQASHAAGGSADSVI